MFRIHALPAAQFQPLFSLSDEELAAHDIVRVTADAPNGFPCRVGLRDAEPGERLLLLPYEHHAVASPYRGSGAIYVREHAAEASPPADEVPEQLRRRLLSVRAYGADGMMRIADVVDGQQIETLIARFFDMPGVEYLHVHYARYGCYACRITREV
ncbi:MULTISPECIES: DUF1203 domain-containing protein [unclassified Lysobacter]|uniref:DUF1203 domain-containing protein n=1 Tax=unclassified Lysobacter TaxID=2635362 RepID=UPI001C23E2B5|nr:DUF1203 domain-containing protein [Lysobacter sp. MMG2]MBU8976948.1 DUF1203 domain-containing protein [Lysobacter sp. MMG2]